MFRKKDKGRGSSDAGIPEPPRPASPDSVMSGMSQNVAPIEDVDDPKNRETFTGKMSVGRRRFNEKMGQKMGKDATDDAEFAERHTRVMELAKKIEKVKLSMKRQLDASRSLCLAAADLGNACSDADVRDVQFQNIQYQLDESIRKTLDENLMQALESLDKKLAPFKDLDKRVKARSNLKLDYDHYVRKVRDLKEKSNADPAKLTNNEVKLEKAKNRVHQATATCYKAFNYYDAIGGRLVTPELELFKKAQLSFFTAALECVKAAEIRDPTEVTEEVERIGREGMSRTVTTGFEPGSAGPLAYGSHSNYPGSVGSSPRSHMGSVDGNSLPEASPVVISTAPWMSNAGGNIEVAEAQGGTWWDKSTTATSSSTGNPPPAIPVVAQAAPTTTAKALYDYTAQDNTEISFKTGDTITVIEKHESGWWTGEKGSSRGLFPGNYVQLLS